MNQEWLNRLAAIRAIPVDDRLSDKALLALTQIHLSVANLLAAYLPDGAYGDAAWHREAVARLYALACRRSRSNQSLMRCSRMLPGMYQIFYLSDTLFDNRKHDTCMRRTFRVADAWRKAGCPSDEKGRITECDVLRGILDAFAYVAEEDKKRDRDFLYLRRRIAEWVSEIDESGRWNGVSGYEAMRRADIMIGNSNTYGDTRFDTQIANVLHGYFASIVEDTQVDCGALYCLYWAMRWGVGAPEWKNVERIVARAEQLSGQYPPGGDAWLWCMAVVIDRECEKIADRLKRRMLGVSA